MLLPIKINFEIKDSCNLNDANHIIERVELGLLRLTDVNLKEFNNKTNAAYGYLNNPYKLCVDGFNNFKREINESKITRMKNQLLGFYLAQIPRNKTKINISYFFDSCPIITLIDEYNHAVILYNKALENSVDIIVKYLNPHNLEYIVCDSQYVNRDQEVIIIHEHLEDKRFRTCSYAFNNDWYLVTCKSIISFEENKHSSRFESYFKELFPEEYL